ncbi:hypothetical protein Lcho_0881 [Leptothrix cholodnii SP-6]|uniref:Uncharacterized protein n=2 Tax=Leptothrix cholodnii TaxID=34029 RepID=B1Y1X3_LEPCP|nr:hypothetical protein Lcho_0881 [Leptothrix cholodnii SP-6]
MWLLISRRVRSEMPYWPGRRLLAAIDALVWPAVWLVVLMRVEVPMGVTRSVFMAVLAMCAVSRLWRATFDNSDYTFTTWRWGKVLGGLLLVSWFIQLTLART